jgi:hypothetical protein
MKRTRGVVEARNLGALKSEAGAGIPRLTLGERNQSIRICAGRIATSRSIAPGYRSPHEVDRRELDLLRGLTLTIVVSREACREERGDVKTMATVRSSEAQVERH